MELPVDRELYLEIYNAGGIAREQLRRLLDENEGDIDSTFLGFTDTYKQLARIIPVGRTVIDLGSAYAFQGWYFRRHKKYIAVDVHKDDQFFRVPNGEYYSMDIKTFIHTHEELCRNLNVFAIYNYVPPSAPPIVRETFRDLFCFYPENGDHPELDRVMLKMKNIQIPSWTEKV